MFHFPVSAIHSPAPSRSPVTLIPFQPTLHAPLFFAASAAHPSLYQYLPFGPFPALQDFVVWYEHRVTLSPACVLFSIKVDPSDLGGGDHDAWEQGNYEQGSDLVQGEGKGTRRRGSGPEALSVETFAGTIGLLNTDPDNASAEVGFLIILPEFTGQGIATRALATLTAWCLDVPPSVTSPIDPPPPQVAISSASAPPLALRRLQYQAHASNLASIGVARKVGFEPEGVLKWERVLGANKEGRRSDSQHVSDAGGHYEVRALNNSDVKSNHNSSSTQTVRVDKKSYTSSLTHRMRGDLPGRDTMRLSICWDEWEFGGGRERVRAFI